MLIEYDSGPCGSGKTARCVKHMATKPGRYIYAVDRRKVVADRRARILAECAIAGTNPTIRVVRAPFYPGDPEGCASVRDAIERLPGELDGKRHAIVIVTHEGLKASDWDQYADFHLIVDEVPQVLYSDEWSTPACVAHFTANYDLEPIGTTKFSRVRAKPEAIVELHDGATIKTSGITVPDLQRDDVLSSLVVFHRRVLADQGAEPIDDGHSIAGDHAVYVTLRDWAEMALPKAKWRWFSLFDMRELRPFRKIWVVGNAFKESLTYHLVASCPDIEFRPLPANPLSEPWQPRKVTIRYVANSHVAGPGVWTDAASPYLNFQHRWAEWCGRTSHPDTHYWSANNRHLEQWDGVIPGPGISAKCSGSNDYRDRTVVSVCLAAKASPTELSVYSAYGITRPMVTRAREYEDILQVVFRSSLRMPGDTRPVEIRVYDHAQAAFLRDDFKKAGFPFEVAVEYVDIGLDNVVRRSQKDQRLDRTLQGCETEEDRQAAIERSKMTKAQRQAAYRERLRAEKLAAGETIRLPGRPKKAA